MSLRVPAVKAKINATYIRARPLGLRRLGNHKLLMVGRHGLWRKASIQNRLLPIGLERFAEKAVVLKVPDTKWRRGDHSENLVDHGANARASQNSPFHRHKELRRRGRRR